MTPLLPTPIRRIVIAGGGTAGWMVAAGLAKCLGRQYDICLVESEEIGTVGVGEATIPTLHFLHEILDLDEQVFIRATQATFKLGISFENWRNVGEHYFHSFGRTGKPHWTAGFHHFWLEGRRRGVASDYGDYCFELRAALEQRFEALRDGAINYAYHFDATLYGRFLREYAEGLGVRRHEGKIAQVLRDPSSGALTALQLHEGPRIDGDFFIDCTGMRALLLGEALGVGFESWAQWLPCDRAVAVQTTLVGEPLPYTRSIAHPWGWQWRIPLQHRVGNGLVYSSRHISDEAARQALLANVQGEVLRQPRVIPFTPGQRDEVWRLNCVAIGLSSGFLEPLESTSIHLIQKGLTRLVQMFPTDGIYQSDIDEYNRQSRTAIEGIRDFIILHYHVNQRSDSDFWRHCREMSVPEPLRHRIQMFRDSARLNVSADELFAENSWVQVMMGQGIQPAAHHPITRQMETRALADFLGEVRKDVARKLIQLPRHQAFINTYCKAGPPPDTSSMGAPVASASQQHAAPLWQPQPSVQTVELEGGARVYVVDDFATDPASLVRWVQAQQAAFQSVPGHPYPGPQLSLPEPLAKPLEAWYQRHALPLLGGGLPQGMNARFSRVLLDPAQLDPRQRICHRDDSGLAADQRVGALVHYLFEDERLGGTVFFRSRLSQEDTERLFQDANHLDAMRFERRYGVPAAYMTQSNALFEVIGRVPARWNRAVFYDGSLLHSGDIQCPAAMLRAPGPGRLTLNGFFQRRMN
ncbi:MAG: tryptophan 7-halogenase [Burkholderiales bacterium]|nr:tryptophan 7-halogenase [Burkholderiales bacterium]